MNGQRADVRPARVTYQPLAWIERFSDDEAERDACRLALNEIDRHRAEARKAS